MRGLATLHTYFGERARIKRSLLSPCYFIITIYSENCAPGLAFWQKRHNLCRTVRGRTLGCELISFTFFSYPFFSPFLDRVERRIDTLSRECRNITRRLGHCKALRRKHRRVLLPSLKRIF
ncbi:hypothetical protein H4582DRAFT_1988348 [Lactarius indigo]|nr:hypothetical protein H4582DRAFT_1988348 [Lactarius indigo]